jgi:HAD superfamily hydrolase (TIGR01662 family)
MQTIIILVGFPTVGKTTYAERYKFPENNSSSSVIINSDQLNDQELKDSIKTALIQHKNIIIDGLHPSIASRSSLISFINKTRIYVCSIECHWLNSTWKQAKLFNKNKTNIKTYISFQKNFEEPSIKEGFNKVIAVPFEPFQALFFDLDDTIRYVDGGKHNFPTCIEEIKLFDDISKVLKIYFTLGYKLIGVTNQSCIAKSIVSEKKVQDCLIHTVKLLNVPIDDIFYCPHQESDKCICRKPGIQMALRAKNKHCISLHKSVMVGDNDTADRLFAATAGIGKFYKPEKFFHNSIKHPV